MRDPVLISGIVRNEFGYMPEWLAFHRCLGLSKFVLGDNDSDDGTSELLVKLHRLGLISRIWFPDRPPPSQQQRFYNLVLERFGPRSEVIGFIDADEFLAPSDLERPFNFLNNVRRIPDAAGVVVNWRLFGSSGHQKRQPGMVIERFTRNASDPNGFSQHVKSFVFPGRIEKMRIHDAVPKPGFRLYGDDGIPRAFDEGDRHGPRLASDDYSTRIRLNHYVIKSWQEFKENKQHRGFAAGKTHMTRPDSYFHHHDRNEEEFRFPPEFVEKVRTEKERIDRLVAEY